MTMAERVSKGTLIGIVESMATDELAKPAERIKAIEFLLEHSEEGEGDVQEVWDELFLVVEQGDE